jgi:hypothetical protein
MPLVYMYICDVCLQSVNVIGLLDLEVVYCEEEKWRFCMFYVK